MNIVLTGFMASGKTSISRAIAEMSQYTLEDTDSMIVTQTGMSINEIFKKYGEPYFRELERGAVRKAARLEKAVIATGGGTVLDKRNIDELRQTGVIFNLAPDFEVIAERVENARESRPLMRNESMEAIKERFEKRQPYYDDCDVKIRVVQGRTARSYALEILQIMEKEVKK